MIFDVMEANEKNERAGSLCAGAGRHLKEKLPTCVRVEQPRGRPGGEPVNEAAAPVGVGTR
jgi:hypothetical protein